ncbi:MAG: hypothetical protein WD030_08115 [Pirellulales bacterium]
MAEDIDRAARLLDVNEWNFLPGKWIGRTKMNVQIPSDVGSAVQKLIADGKFGSQEEVVLEGLRLVIEREELESMIQAGIDGLDAGNRIEATKVHAEVQRYIQSRQEQHLKK